MYEERKSRTEFMRKGKVERSVCGKEKYNGVYEERNSRTEFMRKGKVERSVFGK